MDELQYMVIDSDDLCIYTGTSNEISEFMDYNCYTWLYFNLVLLTPENIDKYKSKYQ